MAPLLLVFLAPSFKVRLFGMCCGTGTVYDAEAKTCVRSLFAQNTPSRFLALFLNVCGISFWII